jgi:hypothetical protein
LGALLALYSSGMVVLWLVVIPAVQNHSRRPLPASAHMMFAVNGVIYGLLTALGIWWVVYFNLRPLRAFFTQRGSLPGAALEGGQEPLTLANEGSDVTAARVVVLIYAVQMLDAVQMLLGAVMMLGVTALHLPFFFAGVVLHGEAAFFGYLLFVALEIFIGIGLFRKLRAAYYVAIAFQIAWACSMLTLLAPSVRTRALLYFQEVSSRMTMGRAAPPPPSVPHMQAMIYVYVGIVTLVLLGIYVWGLLRDLASLPLADAAIADSTK